MIFTILQNCITIEKFKQNYESLIKFLLTQKKTEIFQEAFNALNTFLKNRQTNNNDDEENQSQTNVETNDETKEKDDDAIICD